MIPNDFLFYVQTSSKLWNSRRRQVLQAPLIHSPPGSEDFPSFIEAVIPLKTWTRKHGLEITNGGGMKGSLIKVLLYY